MATDEERTLQYEQRQKAKVKDYIDTHLEPGSDGPISVDPVQLSIAISLKRIADVLEEAHK